MIVAFLDTFFFLWISFGVLTALLTEVTTWEVPLTYYLMFCLIFWSYYCCWWHTSICMIPRLLRLLFLSLSYAKVSIWSLTYLSMVSLCLCTSCCASTLMRSLNLDYFNTRHCYCYDYCYLWISFAVYGLEAFAIFGWSFPPLLLGGMSLKTLALFVETALTVCLAFFVYRFSEG